MTRTSIIIRILLAIALFFSGFFFYGKFVSLYLFDEDFVYFESLSPSDQTKHVLMFGICLMAIPVASIFLKLTKVKSILISMSIISGFLLFGILIKRFLFMSMIESESETASYGLSLDKVLPELYMIVALIIGYCLLHHLKKEEILFRKDSPDLSKEIISQLPTN